MTTRDNLKEFFEEFKQKKRDIDDLVRRKMPVFAGRIAVNHVQENFRKGGFVNGGLQKWKKSNREIHGGKSAAGNYGTLLSARNHLYGSTKYVPADYKVVVRNDVVVICFQNCIFDLILTAALHSRRCWIIRLQYIPKQVGN